MRLSVARLGRQGELVDALTGELEVLLRMTESFSAFAKLPAPVPRELDLAGLLEEVCALHEVRFVGGGECRISGDADQLRRAFTNLVKNAVEAGPPVEVALTGRTVSIRDHGPGVAAPLDGRRLITSLGTSKPGGSGLGLPVAAKIVHDHGGELRLEPAEGGGARAVVRLPG
jgi:signal transduction histidine kinase